jgi:predicted nucleic acid-binding protein
VILVDTSIWVDHLRTGDLRLADLLDRGVVAVHPFVIGEIACGSLANRLAVLELLGDLPQSAVATGDELLAFIERHALHGKGMGYVDVHLLASTVLTASALLWTRDKRLNAAAMELGWAYQDTSAH